MTHRKTNYGNCAIIVVESSNVCFIILSFFTLFPLSYHQLSSQRFKNFLVLLRFCVLVSLKKLSYKKMFLLPFSDLLEHSLITPMCSGIGLIQNNTTFYATLIGRFPELQRKEHMHLIYVTLRRTSLANVHRTSTMIGKLSGQKSRHAK